MGGIMSERAPTVKAFANVANVCTRHYKRVYALPFQPGASDNATLDATKNRADHLPVFRPIRNVLNYTNSRLAFFLSLPRRSGQLTAQLRLVMR